MPMGFEVRDLWPESIAAVGVMKEGFAMRMLRHVEKALYEGAERIVTVTEPMRVRLTDRGVRPEKIGVVPNGADLERLMPRIGSAALAARLRLQNKFHCRLCGNSRLGARSGSGGACRRSRAQ